MKKSWVIIGDQDSEELIDAKVSGPYFSEKEANEVCEALAGDENHGTYYVVELFPPLSTRDFLS